jgi:hypothetical protein
LTNQSLRLSLSNVDEVFGYHLSLSPLSPQMREFDSSVLAIFHSCSSS